MIHFSFYNQVDKRNRRTFMGATKIIPDAKENTYEITT